MSHLLDKLSSLFSRAPDPRAVYPVPAGFTVTAHSGSMGLPANSIEAMEAGVRAGASIVEFDLQFTAEGEPVLSHDRPRGRCEPLSAAFAFLAAHPEIRANVDVKTTSYLEKIAPMARAAGVLDRLFYTGVGEDWIDAVREKSPEIPFYLNTGLKEPLGSVAALCERTGALGINLHFHDITPEKAAFFREHGLFVSIYTPTAPREIAHALACFPDNVTSRRPDLVCGMAITPRGNA